MMSRQQQNRGEAADSATGYFCRGCGLALEPGKSLFHKECLSRDKLRRIHEQREQQQVERRKWLEKQVCPHCKHKFGDQPSKPGRRRADKRPRETSQEVQESLFDSTSAGGRLHGECAPEDET
jgi:hypothetical protein